MPTEEIAEPDESDTVPERARVVQQPRGEEIVLAQQDIPAVNSKKEKTREISVDLLPFVW